MIMEGRWVYCFLAPSALSAFDSNHSPVCDGHYGGSRAISTSQQLVSSHAAVSLIYILRILERLETVPLVSMGTSALSVAG